MTLEQRIEALEKQMADMKDQQKSGEEVGELMRKVTEEVIKKANRPGGLLYAARKQAASPYFNKEQIISVRDEKGIERVNLGPL